MAVSNSNQIHECNILLAYARQAKTSAQGDVTYWQEHADPSAARARAEISRAHELLVACDATITALQSSRDAALAGFDVSGALKAARKTLDVSVHCKVREGSKGGSIRRVRAYSVAAPGNMWPSV